MRIGLEMSATQTESRGRGIGRYVRSLASALAAIAPEHGHELICYAEDGPPVDHLPVGTEARPVRPSPTMQAALSRLVAANTDGLDAFVFLSPVEMAHGHGLPDRPAAPGLRLASIVYDFIPLRFPDDYLKVWPRGFARRYLTSLERLRTFDRLFTISESTRDDALNLLGASPGRVVAVGCGAGDDPDFSFGPGDPNDPADLAALRPLGLSTPFVLSVGASDPRKNLPGLVDAFGRLPAPLRASHTLAVVGRIAPDDLAALRRESARRGFGVVTTGPVDDSTLRALYRHAAALAFTSRFEGFGLPIIEAFRCGTPVVAGRNSAQPEVAGPAALLVDVDDPSEVAEALRRILTDPHLAQSLRDAGHPQAARFNWPDTAARLLRGLESSGESPPGRCPDRSRDGGGPTSPRARIALVAAMPPRSPTDPEPLIARIARYAAVDLFHDTGDAPFARFRLRPSGVGSLDAAILGRMKRLRAYDLVIYVLDVRSDGVLHAVADPSVVPRPSASDAAARALAEAEAWCASRGPASPSPLFRGPHRVAGSTPSLRTNGPDRGVSC